MQKNQWFVSFNQTEDVEGENGRNLTMTSQ